MLGLLKTQSARHLEVESCQHSISASLLCLLRSPGEAPDKTISCREDCLAGRAGPVAPSHGYTLVSWQVSMHVPFMDVKARQGSLSTPHGLLDPSDTVKSSRLVQASCLPLSVLLKFYFQIPRLEQLSCYVQNIPAPVFYFQLGSTPWLCLAFFCLLVIV